jgi:uncharacterized protein YdaU (DUF1376 family)
LHYYKKNIGDYAKKAGRLSMLQHGAYTLLIDACYDRERFPTLEEALEWTWASTEAEIEAVSFVLKKFFTANDDGVYEQKRIVEELAKYHETAKTNKRIAIERETKRRENSTKRARPVNEAPPNHKPLTKNQEPLTKNQEPKSSKHLPDAKPKSVERFNIFWKLHPKKKSKGAAEKAWKRMTAEEQQAAIDKLPEAMDSADWKKDGGKFIPYPATWLNSKGWEDEFEGAMDRYQDFINGDAGNVYEGEVENADF